MQDYQPVELHPASLKYLGKGHPWIIKDNFTEAFKAKSRFLLSKDKATSDEYLLLNDTAHPKIKARLWQTNPRKDFNFIASFEERLQKSLARRKVLFQEGERENIFLCFGEADFIPGLFIVKLGEGCLIQSYARLWKKFQKDIIPIIRKNIESFDLGVKWLAWQERDDSKDTPLIPLWGKLPTDSIIKEWGVRYSLKFNEGYDIGIYTDMAAIRKQYGDLFKGRSFLNLYAYTGAWSLFALSKGAKNVTSSDLSRKYLDWLEENLKLNSFSGEHQSIEGDSLKSLQALIRENQKFDLILCDPPSFSSDKKRTTPAIKAYELLVPSMEKLLNPRGKIFCFLNTHGIGMKKFEEKIRECAHPLGLKIHGKIKLGEDCPTLKGFPEGDYLKGIILKK